MEKYSWNMSWELIYLEWEKINMFIIEVVIVISLKGADLQIYILWMGAFFYSYDYEDLQSIYKDKILDILKARRA